MLSFSVFNKFKAIDGVTAPVRRMTKNVGKFGKEAVAAFKRADRASSRFGKKLRKRGREMSIKLTAPLIALSGLAIRASMSFNKAMANVGALIPGQIKRLKILKKTVQDLAIALGEQPGGLVVGLYQIISALGDTADTEKILEINTKAAKAGLASVAQAVDLTTGVMLAYGETSAKAARKTADLAFTTVKLGKTTLPELAASMGRVVSWASQLGISREELFAGFGTLSGVTGKSSEVSTQMAAILRGLVKQTTFMKAAVHHLGYESGVAMVRSLGLQKTLMTLSNAVGGNEVAITELFGSEEALGAIFAITGKLADRFTKTIEANKNAAGALDEAFHAQTQTIAKAAFTWDQFKAKVTVLSQRLGDALAPAFMKILEFLSPMIDGLEALSPTTKMIMIVIAALAAVIGPLVIAFGMMATAITAIMAIGAPVIITIAAIMAALIGVGAAIYQVVKNWDFLKNEFMIGLQWISKMHDKLGVFALLNPFTGILYGIKQVIKYWDKIKGMGGKIASLFGIGGGEQQPQQQKTPTRFPISPNAGLAGAIRQETETRSRVSVDFSNLPKGTKVDQSGKVPGFDLELGYAGA